MAKKEKLITVLDIGGSKVCCLIGLPQKDGSVNVLGYGISGHNYLKNGVVVDINGLSETINKVIADAEARCGRKVQSAFLNFSGTHIKGIISKGEVLISDKDNEITRHDIDRVMANAKAMHMPYERDIIYTVNKGFSVDNEKGITNPVGMFGLKLETELYLVTAKISIIDNIKKAVRQAGMAIDDHIISGIATSYSCITQHQKELGAILIDIGKDLTEILIFLDGSLSFISILPIGGDKVTKALSEKFRIPENIAETVKIENGTLEEKRRDDKIAITIDSRKKTIPYSDLNKVLAAEYKEIFNAIKKELSGFDRAKDAASGITMTGAAVMMDGCLEQAEMALNFPTKMAHITGLSSSPKQLPSHIYAASAGLLKYAGITKRLRKSIFSIGPKNLAMTITERFHRLYHDYF